MPNTDENITEVTTNSESDHPAHQELTEVNKSLEKFFASYLNNKNESIHNLYRAIVKGKTEEVKIFLNDKNILVSLNECLTTPLHVAAFFNQKEILNLLIEEYQGVQANSKHKKNINRQDAKGFTPFDFAVQEGHEEIVKGLWDNYLSDNPQKNNEKLKLFLQFIKFDKKIFDLFKEKMAKLPKNIYELESFVNSLQAIQRFSIFTGMVNPNLSLRTFFENILKEDHEFLRNLQIVVLFYLIKKGSLEVLTLFKETLLKVLALSKENTKAFINAILNYAIVIDNKDALEIIWEQLNRENHQLPLDSATDLLVIAIKENKVEAVKFLLEQNYYKNNLFLSENIKLTDEISKLLLEKKVAINSTQVSLQLLKMAFRLQDLEAIERIKQHANIPLQQLENIIIQLSQEQKKEEMEYDETFPLGALKFLLNNVENVQALAEWQEVKLEDNPIHSLTAALDKCLEYVLEYGASQDVKAGLEQVQDVKSELEKVLEKFQKDFPGLLKKITRDYNAYGLTVCNLLQTIEINSPQVNEDLKKKAKKIKQKKYFAAQKELNEYQYPEAIKQLYQKLNAIIVSDDKKRDEQKTLLGKYGFQGHTAPIHAKKEIKKDITKPKVDHTNQLQQLESVIRGEIKKIFSRTIFSNKSKRCLNTLQQALKKTAEMTMWSEEQKCLYLALMMLHAFNQRRIISFFGRPSEPSSYKALYKFVSQAKWANSSLLKDYRNYHESERKKSFGTESAYALKLQEEIAPFSAGQLSPSMPEKK